MILSVFLCVIAAVVGQTSSASPVGRWQVKFALMDSAEKNAVFTAREGGAGSLQLLDTGPDNKPVPDLQPAAWSTAKGSLSVSSEVELQIGNCCRETGSLIFKAKLASGNSISGKLIFVTNIDEDESPYKYHATVGTFTATRLQ